ncbi:UDP-2,3-diacylglucosamine diphosphatase [Dyadobacter frigoris]|uniref:UDP-2,3-diacylglucosamine diphosphatase n=1 Tax=Dyadobacter frigoris TaxID=2576211 RepID=A0A4U6D3K8_9BACT|nr:UDP-2,3-diacylglucosamine diphosphatase [Dyadobacter frigoris]TKT91870.1 UDP-2,3-diacylglucosamine diphosphatase [Dyadobacter frigoris]GLU53263.1 UDP-2,3-diacylglucosamine hydrolase [Dyadobacter frigoris]
MIFNFETRSVALQEGRKIYFSSDFHLGVPTAEKSRDRERVLVKWLESIEYDAQIIFLVGDIFDFWFEYGHVVPKGFVRLLGKLAELSDRGIELILFTGNHDMWMFGYLKEEIGATIFRNPVNFEITNSEGLKKSVLVGHGDGLGPGDKVYKILKQIFENSFFQWIFRIVHPDVGMWIASEWSKRSRIANIKKGEEVFVSEEYEWLLHYCKEVEKEQHHDYYIFGHRHLVLDLAVNNNSRYINLGEWVTKQTKQAYATFDGEKVFLREFV